MKLLEMDIDTLVRSVVTALVDRGEFATLGAVLRAACARRGVARAEELGVAAGGLDCERLDAVPSLAVVAYSSSA